MKPAKKTLSILIAAAGIATVAFALTRSGPSRATGTPAAAPVAALPAPLADPVQPAPVAVKISGLIQIALLLDTSSSMSGLVDQARTQLWKIVNELGALERDGGKPHLEIALYEYGKSTLAAETGYIRQVVPLTDDLDGVSEQLFALTTNGGDEFAGQVIQVATRELAWSERAGDLKLIFIAGNEDFGQGPVPFAEAIAGARKVGITVNTIYCGPEVDPSAEGWRQGAALAAGRSLHIDHNQVAVHIPAPQDDEIARLGVELNKTYLGYGALGAGNAARQAAQDGNAAQAGSIVARAQSKASAMYNNSTWDLVDGLTQGAVSWDQLAESDLPEEMRSMAPAQRKAHVEAQRREREALQERIRELSAARDAFVAKKRRDMAGAGASTLDMAMLDMIRDQAGQQGYKYAAR